MQIFSGLVARAATIFWYKEIAVMQLSLLCDKDRI